MASIYYDYSIYIHTIYTIYTMQQQQLTALRVPEDPALPDTNTALLDIPPVTFACVSLVQRA